MISLDSQTPVNYHYMQNNGTSTDTLLTQNRYLEYIKQQDITSIKESLQCKEISVNLKDFIMELKEEFGNWAR
jgi:hypothetical protein